MSLWIDSSWYIAVADPKDQWHAAATMLLPLLKEEPIVHTHALVLGEVAASVGSRRGGKALLHIYETIRDTTTIWLPTMDDLDAALRISVRYDGTISLADTLLIHFIAKHDPQGRIVSFDQDFDGKGIQRIS